MELFETPGNAMPPGAIVSGLRTSDGLKLRVARWPVAGESRGTVAIAAGRGEFVEQYYEVIAALRERRFDVVIWDWRGQGQSDREIRAARRGHVSSFAAYRRDLAAVETQVLRAFAPRPWFALGHSMGGAILIDQAHDGTSPFERLVLSAPMIDLRLRYKTSIRRLIRAMDLLGFGSNLVPGGKELSLINRGFAENILTRDPRQYARLATAIAQLPNLAVGAPTVRWLAGAFRLMRRFEDPFYPAETLVPMLIVAAGADRIIDVAATERFAIRLKAGSCVVVPGSRHQLIMETEAVLAQFWAAFDAFVPGEAMPEASAAPPPPNAVAAPANEKPSRLASFVQSIARPKVTVK